MSAAPAESLAPHSSHHPEHLTLHKASLETSLHSEAPCVLVNPLMVQCKAHAPPDGHSYVPLVVLCIQVYEVHHSFIIFWCKGTDP
jgi:hypothetical protein